MFDAPPPSCVRGGRADEGVRRENKQDTDWESSITTNTGQPDLFIPTRTLSQPTVVGLI
jgi:hypothetical protein